MSFKSNKKTVVPVKRQIKLIPVFIFKLIILVNSCSRKVAEKEKITTPAGTFDCVKVIGNRTITMYLIGKERNMGKPTQEHVWISPAIGTVKQENYTEKGKLESMSHLIEFKM